MKKTTASIFSLALVLLTALPVFAENIQFDPSTPEGRKAAYSALNRQNTLNNAARLEKGLQNLAKGNDPELKQQAEALVPMLEKLQTSLK